MYPGTWNSLTSIVIIGTMVIEDQAYRIVWITLSVSLASLLLGPILSCAIFKRINSTLHPYYDIIGGFHLYLPIGLPFLPTRVLLEWLLYSHLSNKRGGGCKKCKITKCGGGNKHHFWARIKSCRSKEPWEKSSLNRFCNNIRHFSNEINKRGGGIFFWGGWYEKSTQKIIE